ncbi:MAG: Dam family site-specific DNA-(adenine-N6)-methyltransferase [Campylobacterales bacterium]|nr:Dam family site-specific DNA-(adenine-N6)-methyltransferase [Campylobacterales bacterium]
MVTTILNKQSPFLRWAGGKRWLTSKYSDLFPKEYNTYIEAFLGGGSVYFHLEPKKAILSDLNYELITTYQAMQENPSKILKVLKKHSKKHSKEYYYEIRDKKPRAQIEIAARFIYLNRTCFNGIYRVNSSGKFNVPFGERYKIFLQNDDFIKISDSLKNTEIIHSDFETTIDKAQKNDFLFIDPPYTVTHNNNGFVQYNEKLFSWDDQVRLANKLIEAKNRGVLVMATNANHERIRELYEKDFSLLEVSRYTSISGLAKNRKSYSELVIRSY